MKTKQIFVYMQKPVNLITYIRCSPEYVAEAFVVLCIVVCAFWKQLLISINLKLNMVNIFPCSLVFHFLSFHCTLIF